MGKNHNSSGHLLINARLYEQAEGRKLIEDHHDKLIEALHSLTDIAEVHVAKMKEMDERTRIELLSRATVRNLLAIFVFQSTN